MTLIQFALLLNAIARLVAALTGFITVLRRSDAVRCYRPRSGSGGFDPLTGPGLEGGDWTNFVARSRCHCSRMAAWAAVRCLSVRG